MNANAPSRVPSGNCVRVCDRREETQRAVRAIPQRLRREQIGAHGGDAQENEEEAYRRRCPAEG